MVLAIILGACAAVLAALATVWACVWLLGGIRVQLARAKPEAIAERAKGPWYDR